ncbi:helix-turn-helix domain-containing protein [Paenibacillus sp. 481]|uniref:helix-turn-helix domain-containing protein n=1 Tax=Paenibacillus sp. 481 TaxID=2835869 RepID=UPI001E2B3432|nr:helix-turn-helix transcriptional regulator [Paenibacillus sp. 481]UHA73817.1 helix-turn-helix transcriptional regulator [Paenibacillus sp. 481]
MSAVTTPLGELIHKYRRKAEMTLAQLQELTGTNKSNLSRIENGEVRRPDFNKVRTISEVLHIPTEDIIKPYIELEHRSAALFLIFHETLQTSNTSLITAVAAKFLQSADGDSYDLVEQLYITVNTIKEVPVKLALLKLIVEHCRNHGMQPFVAKGLYQQYLIERNDFATLNTTYVLGEYALKYAQFLTERERIVLHYVLGIHAYCILHFDEAIRLSEYVIEHDKTDSEYKASAILNVSNAYYYLGKYEISQFYLDTYSTFSFPQIKENAQLRRAMLLGKTGDIESAILQLADYLNHASAYNIIYAVTELMDLYLTKNDLNAAKRLLQYEADMEQSIQDIRTTPFKRSKLAYFYQMKGKLLLNELELEAAFDAYLNSALTYKQISLYDGMLQSISSITQSMVDHYRLLKLETVQKANAIIKTIYQH